MTNLIEISKKPRRNILVQLLALVLLLLGGHHAMAADCSGSGGSATVTLPSTTVVPRDIATGSPLTAWTYMPSSVYFSCTLPVNSSYYARGVMATPVTAGLSGARFSDSTGSYQLVSTGVAGVGMAVMFSDTYSGPSCGGSNYFDLSTATTYGSSPPPYGWSGGGCYARNLGSSMSFTGRIAVRLVRIPGTMASGGVTTAGALSRICAYTGGPSSSSNMSTYQDGAPCTSINVTSTTIQVAACTTPDVLVPLGTHSPTEMASIGSTTQAVAFHVSLNSCPAGLNQIQYRIEPVTTVVNSAQSLVALDASSSASGVAVQLLNAAGTAAAPLSTSTFQTFSGYNTSTGGSYTIPFQARYYRTGAITPGTANTSMTFTMQYL